jgi:hypothetical protein
MRMRTGLSGSEFSHMDDFDISSFKYLFFIFAREIVCLPKTVWSVFWNNEFGNSPDMKTYSYHFIYQLSNSDGIMW